MGDQSTRDLRNQVARGVANMPKFPAPPRATEISAADLMCGTCGCRDGSVRDVRVGLTLPVRKRETRRLCDNCFERYGRPWR